MLYFHDSDENIDAGEHISEEAVCRICLIEFGNSPETFKMECNCKGELALAHQECATKWFSTKGNRICDVCRQEVQNLSIELLPVHAVQTYNIQGSGANPVAITRYRQVNHFSTGMLRHPEKGYPFSLTLYIQIYQILLFA